MNEYTIYGLKCPITDEIKWVGRTKNLKRRYETHWTNFKSENPQKIEWIKHLKFKQIKPILIILKELKPNEDSNFWENYYINLYIKTVLNSSNGSPEKRRKPFKNHGDFLFGKLKKLGITISSFYGKSCWTSNLAVYNQVKQSRRLKRQIDEYISAINEKLKFEERKPIDYNVFFTEYIINSENRKNNIQS